MPFVRDLTEDALYERVVRTVEAALARGSRTANTGFVRACWLIGREVVVVEQAGEERADNGEQLVERPASEGEGDAED